jgi:nucleotide-binding universal stress UspA family protein
MPKIEKSLSWHGLPICRPGSIFRGPSVFKKILLPIDLSQRHGQAVEVAAGLALQNGGEVTLLHVIEVIAGLSLEEEKGFFGRLEKAARHHLTELGVRLKKRQVPHKADVLFGHPVPEIVRYAKENGAELIVATSPRFDPQNVGMGWGSMSYKISVLAPCPVLLVK